MNIHCCYHQIRYHVLEEKNMKKQNWEGYRNAVHYAF